LAYFWFMIQRVCLSLLFVFAFFAAGSAKAQKKADIRELNRQVLELVNHHRADLGLRPLTENGLIAEAALKHSRDMAEGRVPFGHDGFDERTDKLMREIKWANACAENVAYGARTAQEVVEMWLHSPGHRKNIEGNYTQCGIGIATSNDGTLYYTQIFIRV